VISVSPFTLLLSSQMSKKLVFYLEGSETLIFCQSPLTCCVLQLDWCDLSLSIFVRREMLWVPWRRFVVSWPTTWAHTPSGDGRGCWRGSHSPGEKAELTSRGGLRFRLWGQMLPYFKPHFTALLFLFHLDLFLLSGFPRLMYLVIILNVHVTIINTHFIVITYTTTTVVYLFNQKCSNIMKYCYNLKYKYL